MSIVYKKFLAVAAGVLWASAAVAVESPDDEAVTLEEIVVTAQRTESSLQQTPVSITAFTGEALKEQGITSLLDIGAFTPNLQVGTRSGAAGQGGFAVRGMGVSSSESSPAVGIYIDDVYFPSSSGNLLSLFDVARVEVLRGPQGTLFGRNTIAGAVQYISVKPSTEGLSGFAEASGGNNDRADFSGALNIPLSSSVAMRLSLASRKLGGYVHDDLNNIDRGAESTKDARLQLRWMPTDNLTVDFKAESLKQETNGRAFTLGGVNPNAIVVKIATGQPLPIPPQHVLPETQPFTNALASTSNYQLQGLNAPEFFNFKYETAQGNVVYKLTDSMTLTSITAYSKSASDYATDTDGTPLSILSGTGDEKTKLFTQELRLSGRSFGDRFNWTTGAYYYDQVRSVGVGTFRIGLGSDGTVPPLVLGQSGRGGAINDISSEAYALYAQGTYNLTDRLSGTLGARYSSETIDVQEFPDPVLGYLGANGAGPAIASSDKFTDTSPYVGVNFQVNPDLMAYAKASKGFRAGGGQILNSPLSPPAHLQPFEQETAWTYELGTRMEFMDKRLRINPTLFYTDWTDIQFNATDPASVPYTFNAGDATIKGAELETQFALTSRWLLNASASYLDGKYTRINPLLGSDVTLDDDLQQSPESKYTAGVRYTLPLRNDARIVANANYAWVDTIRSAVKTSTSVQLPSYSLVNAQVQYIAASDRWSLALFGTNLMDEYYLVGGTDLRQGPGSLIIDPARPREYGVTFHYNF